MNRASPAPPPNTRLLPFYIGGNILFRKTAELATDWDISILWYTSENLLYCKFYYWLPIPCWDIGIGEGPLDDDDCEDDWDWSFVVGDCVCGLCWFMGWIGDGIVAEGIDWIGFVVGWCSCSYSGDCGYACFDAFDAIDIEVGFYLMGDCMVIGTIF